MGLLDLARQVKGILPLRFGGTGNRLGWGRATVVAYMNTSGADLPLGTVVQQIGNGGARVEACDTLDSVDVVGVVVGYYAGSDGSTFVPYECPDQTMAAIMVVGRCQVLLDENVSRGEYAFQSSTAGSARGDGTVAAGAFGVFESIGDVGGLGWVRLFGAPVFGAGGGGSSPLTTKGDLYGYDTADARVPVGSNGQVLTADSTAGAGVSWQAGTGTLTTKGDLLSRSTSGLNRLPVGANGQLLSARSGATPGIAWEDVVASIEWELNGPTGGQTTRRTRFPFAGTITGWTIEADATGSCVLDIWKDTYANTPPTNADSIIPSGTKPNLSSAAKAQSSSLSGWTIAVAAGDEFVVEVESSSGLSQILLWLDIKRA